MSLQLLTLISVVVFSTTEAASGEEVMRAVGDQVSFKLDTIVPPVTSITWKHLKAGELTVKAIEWEDGETTVLNPRFKGITTLNKETGQITISKLTVEHTGVYTIDVSGKEQTQRFTLTVMDPVPKPVIELEKINPDVVYLSCKYNERITWNNSAGETLTFQSNTNSITVEKTKGNPENTYTCTLQNAVSEETSDSVYKKDLFNDESDQGPWWIAIVILMILVIFAIPPALYKLCKPFHDSVYKSCGEKPCIGGLLSCLDGKKKDKNTCEAEFKKQDEEPSSAMLNPEKKKDEDQSPTSNPAV